MPRSLFLAALGGAACTLVGFADIRSQIPPVPAPTTALSAGPVTAFPDASGDFEYTAVGAGSFLYASSFPSGPTSWTPWTMGNGTGIASNGSGFTAQNPNAPGPTRVAFMQGVATMSTPFTFGSGTWRLRFKGAQRDYVGINRQVVRVLIGSTEVFEQELVGEDYALYKTRVFSFATSTTTTVTFQGLNPHGGDNTAFVDQIELEPIREWFRPASWDNGVPAANQDAIIPAGVEVSLRGNGQAATVTVEGELLTSFNDATLTTRWVAVMGTQARFEVGHELTPFEQQFTLYLIGDNTAENVMNAGTKFLMAMNSGTVEMHGTPRGLSAGNGRYRTWTKLAAPATSGTSTITLTEPVNWNVDDEIVIAASDTPDPGAYIDQAEKHKILSIAGGGTQLTLYNSLAHAHFGDTAPYSYSNGTRSWSLDRRAEVGLLTHNVKIEGVLGTNQTFGGHVMMMRGSCCTSGNGGRGRFSNVEFYRMGQSLMLGRYPMHWHMQLTQGAGQFMKCCSVHKSFNRAITIHGTDSALVEGNVAYDHVGHGVFLEDASEQNNELYYNLALSTIRPQGTALLPSDNSHDEMQNRTPATYWITNPNNKFVGNVAAGTQGTGFWFIFPYEVTGLSKQLNLFPNLHPYQLALGLFEDNVAHSCSSGYDVHDGISQTHDIIPNFPWEPPGTANQNLDRFTVYGCWLGLYAGFGGELYERLRFRDCVLADNFLNVVFAAYNVVESSAIIARSPSGMYSGGSAAYIVYDGAARLFDSHVVGFTPGYSNFLGDVGAATRHTEHRMHGLTFNPSQPPRIWLDDYNGAIPNYTQVHDLQEPRRWGISIVDEDGSLCGQAGWTIISNHAMMRSAYDITHPQWTNAYASPFRFAHLRVYHPGLDTPCPPYTPPAYCSLPRVTLNRVLASHPVVSFINDYKTDPHKQHPVIMNHPSWPVTSPIVGYTFDWTTLPTSPAEVQVHLDDLLQIANGCYLPVLLNGVGNQSGLVVDRPSGAAVTVHTTYANFLADTVTSCYVDPAAPAPKPLWIKFIKPSGGMIEKLRVRW